MTSPAPRSEYKLRIQLCAVYGEQVTLTQTIDVTHTFRPSLFGDIRISYNRPWNRDPDGALSAGLASYTPTELGLTMPSIPTTTHNYAPEINVERYNKLFGNTGDPSIFETYALHPSMTQVIKRHNLHYGVEYMLFHDIPNGVGQPNGTFGFGTGYTWEYPNHGNNTGGSVADLYLGYPDGGSVQYNLPNYESYREYGAFIQDDWKVSHRLALNLGLRWDTETSPVDRNYYLAAGICLTCVNQTVSQILGSQILGTAQFSSKNLTAYENTFGTFQPKAGFSYALNDKTVIRGGWGLGTAMGIELGGASPWRQQTDYNAQSNSDNWTPTEYFNQKNPFPNGYTPVEGSSLGEMTFVGNGLSIDQRNRKIPVVQSYSFGLQGELPGNIIADLEYVGMHTIDIRTSRQMNGLKDSDIQQGLANSSYLDDPVSNPFYGVLPETVDMGQNPTIARKKLLVPYPQFNGDFYVYTHADGYQNYNSMIAKAEKRMSNSGTLSRGLSFLASFTWAKLMVANGYLNNSASFKVDDKPVYHMDGGNSAPAWALSFSGLYGLPFGRNAWIGANTHGLVSQLISDWQLDWIFQNRAGNPIGIPNSNPYSCGFYNPMSQHKGWGNYVNNAHPECWSQTPEYYINTFDGTQTKVRANFAQQTQLSVDKKFALSEKVKFIFKVDAFNATNTAQFGGPDMGNPQTAPQRILSVADPNQPGAWQGYGTVGSQQQNFPRQFQFSGKVQF